MRVGELTVRLSSGATWSLPFSRQQLEELVEALKSPEHQGRDDVVIAEIARAMERARAQPEWVPLTGPDPDARPSALLARRPAIESLRWVGSADDSS